MDDKQKENLYWILGIVFGIAFVLTFVYVLHNPIDFLIILIIIFSLLSSYFLSLAYQYHKINKG